MMLGYLEANGISVQRHRVRDLLRQVDPEGCAERWKSAVHRRKYKVPTPNFLWHMDGHMKLVRWGFCTHGCIDGYSMLMTFLHCSARNTASTVLTLFVVACSTYGVPTKVRSDYGGENTKVALFLNLVSQDIHHITGRSVQNQRIERIWRNIHEQVTSKYYKLFYDLEDDPSVNLDPDIEQHRLALHIVFLPLINADLQEFRSGWNHHKVRTEAKMTPHQMWISGMLDNIRSSHTATRELFEDSGDSSIRDKLEQGLGRFGLTINDLGEEPDIGELDQLSEQLKTEIEVAISDITGSKEKFLKCLEMIKRQNE